MAETKKTVNVTAAAKAVAAKAADTKTEEAKTTPASSAAEVKKEEPKKAPAKKAAAKKTTAKKAPAKKTAAAKKTTTKTTTKAAAKKTTVKKNAESTVVLQFAGKEYTNEDLIKIAKDVWKYDLKQKVGDFKKVKLFVKPEESKVYFVVNDEVSGEFGI